MNQSTRDISENNQNLKKNLFSISGTPVIKTKKRDRALKISLDLGKKVIVAIKLRSETPETEKFLNRISTEKSKVQEKQKLITKTGLKYAYGQIKWSEETNRQCFLHNLEET